MFLLSIATTGEAIGKTCCVVEASDKEEAKAKSYELCGNDNSALSSIEDFDTTNGYMLTIYRSAFA